MIPVIRRGFLRGAASDWPRGRASPSAPVRVHDLHRPRPRRRLHRAHERGHQRSPRATRPRISVQILTRIHTNLQVNELPTLQAHDREPSQVHALRPPPRVPAVESNLRSCLRRPSSTCANSSVEPCATLNREDATSFGASGAGPSHSLPTTPPIARRRGYDGLKLLVRRVGRISQNTNTPVTVAGRTIHIRAIAKRQVNGL